MKLTQFAFSCGNFLPLEILKINIKKLIISNFNLLHFKIKARSASYIFIYLWQLLYELTDT